MTVIDVVVIVTIIKIITLIIIIANTITTVIVSAIVVHQINGCTGVKSLTAIISCSRVYGWSTFPIPQNQTR